MNLLNLVLFRILNHSARSRCIPFEKEINNIYFEISIPSTYIYKRVRSRTVMRWSLEVVNRERRHLWRIRGEWTGDGSTAAHVYTGHVLRNVTAHPLLPSYSSRDGHIVWVKEVSSCTPTTCVSIATSVRQDSSLCFYLTFSIFNYNPVRSRWLLSAKVPKICEVFYIFLSNWLWGFDDLHKKWNVI